MKNIIIARKVTQFLKDFLQFYDDNTQLISLVCMTGELLYEGATNIFATFFLFGFNSSQRIKPINKIVNELLIKIQQQVRVDDFQIPPQHQALPLVAIVNQLR